MISTFVTVPVQLIEFVPDIKVGKSSKLARFDVLLVTVNTACKLLSHSI